MQRTSAQKRLRLSDSQISAIECADLEGHEALARAFTGTHLVIAESDADSVVTELIEASNSEDAVAEGAGNYDAPARRDARKAAAFLACVSMKVARLFPTRGA